MSDNEKAVKAEKPVKVKETPKAKPWEFKSRTFLLNKKGSKLSSKWIQTRSTDRLSLLWWDDVSKKNRVLRYAANFDSPFMDEQDGTAELKAIRFRNGALHTTAHQVGLQKFLMLHPSFNRIWTLLDKEVEAEDELAILDMEYEAMKIARESDIELIESILRYNLKGAVDNMSTSELRKDAQLFARRSPTLFLELATDDQLVLRNLAVKSVDAGYLKITNDGSTIEWAKNGKKIIDIGYDENPYAKLSQFFKTDQGIDLMKTLQAKFKA